MSTEEYNKSRNPDEDYDLSVERAIIEDLEHIDKLKAELREWRNGPWVRKADHDEVVERFGSLAKKYHAAEVEIGKLRAAIRTFRDAKGRYNTQLAADKLFGMVAKSKEVPA